MTNTFEDPFTNFEHNRWRVAAETYAQYFPPLTSQSIPALLDAANVEAASQTLDIATGPGEAAGAAATLGSSVTAIDFSEEMVALCMANQSGVDARVGDAENLEFADATFGAVIMNYGLLHLAHPEKALDEAFRVLRSGGKFAFSVWQTADAAKGFAVIQGAISQFGVPVELPSGPEFFHYSSPDVSHAALVEAGFSDPQSTLVDQTWHLPDGISFFNAFLGGARTGALLLGQPEENFALVKDSVAAEAEEFRVGDHLEIPMPSVVYSASK